MVLVPNCKIPWLVPYKGKINESDSIIFAIDRFIYKELNGRYPSNHAKDMIAFYNEYPEYKYDRVCKLNGDTVRAINEMYATCDNFDQTNVIHKALYKAIPHMCQYMLDLPSYIKKRDAK